MARRDTASGVRSASATGAVIARRGLPARTARELLRFGQKKPLGAIGGLLVLFLLLVAAFAPLIAPYGPKILLAGRLPFEEPSFATGWNHWGTDQLGRDVFSRIVWGARLSLYVGFLATMLGTTTGMLWGLAQGYWGGSWFDTISQRIAEAHERASGRPRDFQGPALFLRRSLISSVSTSPPLPEPWRLPPTRRRAHSPPA